MTGRSISICRRSQFAPFDGFGYPSWRALLPDVFVTRSVRLEPGFSDAGE